ncbi:MAG TPA: 16S rRNA (guanine(527)-N(7))-methyltransferase RsmG [Cytophagales bacterium]|nr:16S rRNA (guanine(527)-N(7))-methyltransferase RsmG [Cytophagales bacterium]
MDIILKYFKNLDPEVLNKLGQLHELYKDWNEKINVISRKDIDNIYEKHILHSLAIAKFTNFKPGTNILDIGTGGGFPGIPLAIMFPEAKFHLVDSIAKKIKVVQGVAEALKLNNVVAEQNRVEDLTRKYDFIVSRAVAPTDQLHAWTFKKFKKEPLNDLANGYILLKGGDLDEELLKFKNIVTEIDLNQYFEEEFFETKKIIYIPVNFK